MIPKECKRLAEVDFPIAEVSRHAAREKSIRQGHPSNLHLWWARRPLASSRAVLLGLLLPDPCDPLCPGDFKIKAREVLRQVPGPSTNTSEDLRKALLKFIGDFANWDLSTSRPYLVAGRALVRSAHGEEPPLVADPFAGGGSIPLEALRVGCDTFASDLNPVACLILKVMLEDIPRHGSNLADQLRHIGADMKKLAETELADLYPRDPDGATPIAYIWARTVRCEAPHCGAEIPLVRSFWLCKKSGQKRALRHRTVRPAGESPRVEFEIFEPSADRDVPPRTVNRANATCIACGVVLPRERVKAQLSVQRGGADVIFDAKALRSRGARMLAVVTLQRGTVGRHYRLPSDRDYEGVAKARERVAKLLFDYEQGGRTGLCPVPDELIHAADTRNFWVTQYGPREFGDVFTTRQKVTQAVLAALLRGLTKEKPAAAEAAALALSRRSDIANSLCPWSSSASQVVHLFGRQAMPMAWDFAESSPFGGQAGDYSTSLGSIVRVVDAIATGLVDRPGHVQIADAADHPLPDGTTAIWFTDPPYYDAVPYADLSDFFFVWLKRALPEYSRLQDPFDPQNPLTPKVREAVQNEKSKSGDGRPKDKAFYERSMAKAFAEGRRVLGDGGVGCVVFAHKTTEGWEALLSGMIRGGLTITGSWPVATERPDRLRSRESAALATSVHLVCRPRPDNAAVGDWADVLRELPNRVGAWMDRLQGEGIRGADLVFACIGPALEIFSRYTRVEAADGRDVMLAEYLEKVWEVVGRSALGQVLGTGEATARNGAGGAVEEDARLTALFLWTLQSTNGATKEATSDVGDDEDSDDEDENEDGTAGSKAKGFTLVFDVVRRFAQPLGIELPKWDGRIIETKKGVVRLLPIAERARQIFGEEGASGVAARLEQQDMTGTNPLQGVLFPENEDVPSVRESSQAGGKRTGTKTGDQGLGAKREATTLDRVHAAMLLQAGGRTNALRALLKAEQERAPDFLRLANALSALYPKGSEEKRLLDAMLLAAPR